MSLNAQLEALELPSGTEFPGTPQELLELIAQYMAITGLNPFNGINFGPATPSADNRDRPWFKTSNSGNPIGWLSWNGSIWEPIPQVLPVGTTRPTAPAAGTQFFDSAINVALIFERSQWRTLAGSPGDTKFVKAATIEDALALNPGWVQETTSPGRVIGAAGDGVGLTPRPYGTQVGNETESLTVLQMPEHQHVYQKPATFPRFAADNSHTDPTGELTGWAAEGDFYVSSTPPTGEGGLPHANMQPSVFWWCLVKE